MTDKDDVDALTEYWRRETIFLNEKIDASFKNAQDHAYALGFKRGQAAALREAAEKLSGFESVGMQFPKWLRDMADEKEKKA